MRHPPVREWLKAGRLEEGNWSVSETATPQGEVVSPLLANVYLHYVFDLWPRSGESEMSMPT